jgi:small subunit ribosomal protein S18
MQPKTPQRQINFRKSNKRIPRRRYDIKVNLVSYKHPEYLAKFTTETGKILPRRLTGISAWLHRKITREIKRSRAVNLAP